MTLPTQDAMTLLGVGRSIFSRLKLFDKTNSGRKKFPDGDVIALKILWELAEREPTLLTKLESVFVENVFQVCNDESEDNLKSYYAVWDKTANKVALVKGIPMESQQKKLKQIALNIRKLENEQKKVELEMRSLELLSGEKVQRDENRILELELKHSEYESTIIDLEINRARVESERPNSQVENLLALRSYRGWVLDDLVEEFLEDRRALKVSKPQGYKKGKNDAVPNNNVVKL